MASTSSIVITSLYLNIAVLVLIFIASSTVLFYIVNVLWREKIMAPKLLSLGLFWFFNGFTWLLTAFSSYLHAHGSYILTYDILAFHAVIVFGVSITYHVVYKNFYNSRYAWTAAGFIMFLGLIYSALSLTGDWGTIDSDWGIAILPPDSLTIMSIIMGGIFALMAFTDFGICLRRFIKNKTAMNKNEFFVDTAIALAFIIMLIDVVGTPGWRMVLDRIGLLSTALMAILTIYQTSYIPLSIKEEKNIRRKKINGRFNNK